MLWPISRPPGCPSPMEVIGGERSAEQKLWCWGEGGTFSTNVRRRHSDWERHIRFGKSLLIKWMFSTGKHVWAVKIHPRWSWKECFRCWPETSVHVPWPLQALDVTSRSFAHSFAPSTNVELLGAGPWGRHTQQWTRLPRELCCLVHKTELPYEASGVWLTLGLRRTIGRGSQARLPCVFAVGPWAVAQLLPSSVFLSWKWSWQRWLSSRERVNSTRDEAWEVFNLVFDP